MKKLAKKVTAFVVATIMAVSLVVSVHADCSHGNYQTQIHPPYTYTTRTHTYTGSDGKIHTCVADVTIAIIWTVCGYCGTCINQTAATVNEIHHHI